MRELLAREMPALFAHEGLWDGTYRHVDADGTLIDQHRMRTRCEFPDSATLLISNTTI